MRILADTNIVLRLAQPGHRQHRAALQSVERLLAGNHDPCIVPQVIYELWVVATRPASANGLGTSSLQTQAEVAKARQIFSLLRDERAIFQRWEGLVVDYDVKGKSAHDARLVAAMIRHGLNHNLTFNKQDFVRYPEITVMTPDDVAQMGSDGADIMEAS